MSAIQTQQRTAATAPDFIDYQGELSRRMKGPQRHRLLQGYPMPPLMPAYDPGRPYQPVAHDFARPLIVGVLPHAACAPAVKGCGYCTFPHEQFQASRVRNTVAAVVAELEASQHRGRPVEALYFGGGTANLTPPDALAILCDKVKEVFALQVGAEVTLEGAPVFFNSHNQALLQVLKNSLSDCQARVSMGVQTFDLELLKLMGRQYLGAPEQVAQAAAAARERGINISADLMINLPGQSLEQMKADVLRASELGFDQICIYHLVMFRGLGTEWSRDRDLLRSLPDNEQAFDNWREVRALALELGYVQKTLTNFERSGHYRYEECSFHPERFDGIGFGPAALSTFTDPAAETAVKWMNETDSGDYIRAVSEFGSGRARCFVYGETDMRLLYLTRTLPRLEIAEVGVLEHFAGPFQAILDAGLIKRHHDKVSLTERGMFYADSVAGLLAADRVKELRLGGIQGANDPPVFRMG